MSKSKHWCFTINNYTEATERRLSDLRSIAAYIIYGREVGESGTPHLQGFASFPSRKSLRQVTVYFPGGHCSIARYITASITYCKKEGDFTEIGEPPACAGKGRGSRNDLELLKEDVRDGMVDFDELLENHSSVCARYPKFVDRYVRLHAPKPSVTEHQLRGWQADLMEELAAEPDDRTIVFLVDEEGNSGKTWFFSHYQKLFPGTSQILLPGKKADMALCLREAIRVLFVDAPRSKQGDFLQYDFLEEVKNGRVFSSKYDSRMKLFKVPHVVVAMNEYPKMDMLSADRYRIILTDREPAPQPAPPPEENVAASAPAENPVAASAPDASDSVAVVNQTRTASGNTVTAPGVILPENMTAQGAIPP